MYDAHMVQTSTATQFSPPLHAQAVAHSEQTSVSALAASGAAFAVPMGPRICNPKLGHLLQRPHPESS